MTNIACGVIGLGTIGRLYCELIALHGARLGLRITAAADPSPKASPPGVQLYPDHRLLLARNDIDAVLIASPPALHYEHVADSLAAGKDVLVEKPPATSVAQAEALRALSEDYSRVLFFAFHARYGHAVVLAKRRLEQLPSGAITRVEATYRESVHQFHSANSWVYAEGVVRDSGINVFSILTDVVHDRIQVVDAALRYGDRVRAVARANIDLRIGRGGRGHVHLDWEHSGPEQRTITVTAGTDEWTIDVATDRLYANGNASSDANGRNSLEREYQAMFQQFEHCVTHRTSTTDIEPLRLVEDTHRVGRITPGGPPSS
jgi:predicted dehydrogenase